MHIIQDVMEFKSTIGRLVGEAHQHFLKNLDETFRREKVPITAEQFRMMSRLWDQDGISQQTLAEGIGRNRAATGRMVDTLEKHGLVVRQDHPTDRRLNLVFLSRKGKQIQSKAESGAREVLERSMKGLDQKEIDLLGEWLKKIIHNLG